MLWLEPAQYPATSQPASSSPQTETAAASKRERPLSLRYAARSAPALALSFLFQKVTDRYYASVTWPHLFKIDNASKQNRILEASSRLQQ